MNKAELIATIASRSGVSQKQADIVLSTIMDAIIDTVASGDKVTLVGFGTFEKRDRQSRLGRNPKTGEELTIPATSVPGFAAGKLFKDRVASGSNDRVDVEAAWWLTVAIAATTTARLRTTATSAAPCTRTGCPQWIVLIGNESVLVT